jgi:hypothetical protein
MKTIHLAIPATALVIAVIWLGNQRRTISAVEQQNTAMRGRIEAARQAGPAAADRSVASRVAARVPGSGGKIDWKQIALRQAAMAAGSSSDMRAMMEVQQSLLHLSADELVAALGEIAAPGLAASERNPLEQMIVGILAQKDPQRLLEHYADRIGDDRDSLSWQFSHAFGQWALKQPMEAMAWMDQRLAEGRFVSKSLDGGNQNRVRFEAALVKTLLASGDPAAAEQRVAGLPEEQRHGLFGQGLFLTMKPGSEAALAGMVRRQLPEAQRIQTLASAAGQLVGRGGYAGVADFLGKIDAAPDERAAAVSQAVKTWIDRQPELKTSIAETRDWIVAQAPADAGRLTGEALGHMVDKQDYDSMAKLALQYQAESGSDDTLVSFLEQSASRQHPDQAAVLAQRISDPEKRARILKYLGVETATAKPAP